MIKKILIANRGEIAVRIIRTCREMDIRTVALFSDADRASMHVSMADEAYSLKGNTPAETYLRQELIIDIAKRSRADAIHPGYGFLSENPEFVERVETEGLKFIGPSSKAIRSLGDKTAARRIADELRIPTIPGTRESISDASDAASIASKIGYPVLLKAAAGGGGKGMRIVKEKEGLESGLRMAKSEAKSAFGDSRVYIEKYLERPRHIEMQILADTFGNCVYLGERECSIQRRHQKVIEETPSTLIDNEMRIAMGDAAVRLAQSVGYTNAGTVEFLVDQQRNFYFLEVNTRLQVEHPVTEFVTGIDLVRQQILVADGQRLSFTQNEVNKRGHAIECRICAEDPADNFFPSTGTLVRYVPPQGPRVRVDNGMREGDNVTIYYDPLMAKVIVWGQNRSEALEVMSRALTEFKIQGVNSTIPFCLFVLKNDLFRNGNFDTGFVEREFRADDIHQLRNKNEIAAIIAAVLIHTGAQSRRGLGINHLGQAHSPWKNQRQEFFR